MSGHPRLLAVVGLLGGCCFTPTVSEGAAAAAATIDAPVVCWGSASMYVPEPPHAVSLAPGATLFGTGAVVCAHEGSVLRCFGNDAHLGMPLETSTPAAFTLVPEATSLATGTLHACALVSSGEARCWGSNLVGQLGRGVAPDPSLTGTIDLATGQVQLPDVAGLSDDVPAPVVGLAPVMQLAADGSHTCARTEAGTVFCWGAGTHGELGDGNGVSSPTPVAVTDLADAADIQTSGAWTCARTTGGAVRCWGTPDEYPSGPPEIDRTPRAMLGFDGATAISMRQDGASSSMQMLCAIDASRHVLCARGNGAPGPIAGIEHAVAITSGVHHTCALTEDGHVSCFGSSDRGQLGTTDYVDGTRPIAEVSGAHGIVSGRFFSCASR
jgi:hypothetical protein